MAFAAGYCATGLACLNESPSEKEGKSWKQPILLARLWRPSMKVPPKRKGNTYPVPTLPPTKSPSMKVPPKRKGNSDDIHGVSDDFADPQ